MKRIDRFGIKLLFYFGGLLIMTFGVVLSVKSDLGVTPISSIPYTVTVVSGQDLGFATILFSAVMMLLQLLVLRKKYRPIDLLQLPISVLFGLFLTASGKLLATMPAPESLPARLALMLVSTVVVAIGVFLYVSPGFLPLPPEGFVLAVARVTGKPFASIKVVFDVTMVAISMVTCLVMVHALGSVGIGTVVAAVLVGNEVKWLTRRFGAHRDRLLGIQRTR